MKTGIRLGVIVGSPKISGWQAFILEQLAADRRFAFPTVIEVTGKPVRDQAAGRAGRLVDRLENGISRRLFHRGLERKGLRVDQEVSLPAVLKHAAWLKIPSGLVAGGVPGEAIAAVEAADLDVIVNFGPVPLGAALSDAARHGVWSYSFAGSAGTPPGFWDFYRHEPVSGAALLCHQAGVERVAEARAYRTFRFSWNENRRRLLLKATWLMIDWLKRLADTGGMPRLELEDGVRGEASARGRSAPGLLDYGTASAKMAWRAVVQVGQVLLFDQQWRVYVSEGKADELDVGALRSIRPTADCLMADPFPVSRNGKRYIFCEQLAFSEGRGFISVLELPESFNGSGKYIDVAATKIIDTPYHLSYPFLFECDNRSFMIPESSNNKTIELWECDSFPTGWRKARNLFENISAADTTLLRWKDKWWMFTNIDRSDTGDHMAELHIFYSDDPIAGDWQPHPANPVVADARRARMAGGFIVTRDGRLIRCCQKLGIYYGKAVILCEVVELSETAYREVELKQIEPDWRPGVHRTHHLAAREGLLAVDGCHNSLKLQRYFGRLRRGSA